MGFFDWLSGDEEDPNQYVGMSIPDPNEDYSKYGFQDFIKGLTSTVGGLVEIPKKPVDWLASKMSGLPETRPAEELLTNALFPERLAGDPVDQIPTKFGEGGEALETRPATPEEQVFGESVNRIGRKATTTVGGLALNPITPALGLPGAAGKAVAGAFIPGMAESLGEQSGKAMSAYESGDIPGMAENIFGAGLDTLFLGGMAKHIAGREAPISSEVKQSESVSEPIREPAPEFGAPINPDYERIIKEFDEKAAKGEFDLSDQLESEKVAAENARIEADYDTRLQNMTQGLLDRSRPAIQKILGKDPELGGEGLRHIEAVITDIPGTTPAYYSDGKMYIDRNFAKSSTAADLRDIVIHEITHENVKSHNFGNIRPGESPLTGEEGRGIVETSEGQFAELDPKYTDPSQHTREAMEVRGRSGVSEENTILGLEDALKHDPDFVTQLNAYEGNVANLLGERFRARRGLPDIQAPVELRSAPTRPGMEEVGAPSKAGDIERTALEQYAKEQDAKVREASTKFQSAKTEAERSAASKEFQQAKAERDRIQNRITQLGGGKIKSEPVVDTAIREGETPEARRERLMRDIEAAGEQAGEKAVQARRAEQAKKTEVVEETPQSEKVVSAPANNLRRLLEGMNLTRFNVNTLTKELKAKGLEVPAELETQLPELVKELKDRGWVNEKIGGTYTLLTAPPKMLKGVSGGKISDVTNLKGSLEESLKALGAEEPVKAPETAPTPTSTIRPGQFHFDETGRRWEVRRVEGDQVTVTSGRGGGERTQVLSKDDILARRGIMPEAGRGAPMKEPPKEPSSEEIDIDLSSLEEGTKPPDLSAKMKEKLTPDELQAIAKLFGTEKKRKGTSETPQEVLDAQKAALRGLVEKEKKGGEGLPPTEEIPEGGGPKQNFDVTLSDGTTHKVRASSAEEAKAKAEEVLAQYQSSKTVDKVEPTLSTLEKAAKYEIEPVREAGEQISEQVTEGKAEAKAQAKATGEQLKYQEQLRKEQVRETKQLQKTEDKELTQLARKEAAIRRAQIKEKFTEKPYTVNLSNGRTVTIGARNEKIAREVVESAIRRNKSTVTIQGVALKPSKLDEAITGAARKVEETGFLQNPVVRVLNAVKSITFGGDVGHLLRQGKQMNADLLFSKHAKKVWDQVPALWKLAKGGMKELEGLNDRLYSDPDIKMMVDDFGMDMPGMGKGLKEEAFHGAGLAEKLPVIGKHYVERSEAVYTGGLNFLRAAEAKKWIEKLKKDGFTPENAPEKYNSVARAVNIISQRGSFSPAYQKLFSDASAIYGAPRAKAARLQNAVELFRGGESGRVVRTTAAKTLAFNLGLYGLLAATTGAKFIDDPEASDFGKIRINDKITVDPWVGLGVTARTVSKLITGKGKSPYTGKEYPVTPSDALMAEFLGGIAPGVKLAWEAMSGKDLRGYQIDRLESLLNVAPLTAKSIQELVKEGDLDEAIELSILQFMGEGVDVFNYEESKAKQARLRAERGLSTGRGGRKKKRTYAFD